LERDFAKPAIVRESPEEIHACAAGHLRGNITVFAEEEVVEFLSCTVGDLLEAAARVGMNGFSFPQPNS